jgi:hypothetical protein
MKDLGVAGAILTAKHGCGHLLWPTKVPLPDGSEYTCNFPSNLTACCLQ